MKINITKSYFVKEVLYLPITYRTNKNILADINLYDATLAGEKYSRLILIAIKAEPQIADNIKSSNMLLIGFNFTRN